MEIGRITLENQAIFQPLLLPAETEAIRAGEPILALGLVEADTACGAVSGWLSDDTFWVRSLYVAPAYRRKGGGRLLLRTLSQLLTGYAAILAVSFTQTKPEHETLFAFLEAEGFQCDTADSETLYRIPLAEVFAAPFFAQSSTRPAAIHSFREVPSALLHQAYQAEQAQGGAYTPFSLTAPQVEAETSMAYLEGGQVKAFVLLTRSEAGYLTLAWAKGGRDPKVLPLLLKACCQAAKKRYAPEEILVLQAVNGASADLIHTLLPTAESFSYTYRKELPIRSAAQPNTAFATSAAPTA